MRCFSTMIKMRFLLATLLLVTAVSAFIPQHTTFRHDAILKMASDDFQDFENGDDSSEYKGEIDWDSEWKKVVENKNQPTERPGKDFYKSEAEIAAIKVANKAQEQLAEAASKIPSVPSFNSLKGDWKFWIGVLAIISIGSSLLAASGQTQSINNDSFYI